MAQYTVKTWNDETMTTLRDVTVFRHMGYAIEEAYSQAYASLEAFGKLDTQAAHNVMSAIERANDLLPIGEQRSIPVSNTGRTIIISRQH